GLAWWWFCRLVGPRSWTALFACCGRPPRARHHSCELAEKTHAGRPLPNLLQILPRSARRAGGWFEHRRGAEDPRPRLALAAAWALPASLAAASAGRLQ